MSNSQTVLSAISLLETILNTSNLLSLAIHQHSPINPLLHPDSSPSNPVL
jgi:hypothetical protein